MARTKKDVSRVPVSRSLLDEVMVSRTIRDAALAALALEGKGTAYVTTERLVDAAIRRGLDAGRDGGG